MYLISSSAPSVRRPSRFEGASGSRATRRESRVLSLRPEQRLDIPGRQGFEQQPAETAPFVLLASVDSHRREHKRKHAGPERAPTVCWLTAHAADGTQRPDVGDRAARCSCMRRCSLPLAARSQGKLERAAARTRPRAGGGERERGRQRACTPCRRMQARLTAASGCCASRSPSLTRDSSSAGRPDAGCRAHSACAYRKQTGLEQAQAKRRSATTRDRAQRVLMRARGAWERVASACSAADAASRLLGGAASFDSSRPLLHDDTRARRRALLSAQPQRSIQRGAPTPLPRRKRLAKATSKRRSAGIGAMPRNGRRPRTGTLQRHAASCPSLLLLVAPCRIRRVGCGLREEVEEHEGSWPAPSSSMQPRPLPLALSRANSAAGRQLRPRHKRVCLHVRAWLCPCAFMRPHPLSGRASRPQRLAAAGCSCGSPSSLHLRTLRSALRRARCSLSVQ